MKASRSFKLMMLSSTIKTLMGGTELSSRLEGIEDFDVAEGDLTLAGVAFRLLRGRDGRSVDESRAAGVGGVLDGFAGTGASTAGGVGSGGGAGVPLTC